MKCLRLSRPRSIVKSKTLYGCAASPTYTHMRAFAVLSLLLHGYDGVIGSRYMRGTHTFRHQVIERLNQVGHIAASH
jgi:hypothetical protein